jgi:hypothetical protein
VATTGEARIGSTRPDQLAAAALKGKRTRPLLNSALFTNHSPSCCEFVRWLKIKYGGDSIRSMRTYPRDMEVIWPLEGGLLFWPKRVSFAARLRDTQRPEARLDGLRPFQIQFFIFWRLGFHFPRPVFALGV